VELEAVCIWKSVKIHYEHMDINAGQGKVVGQFPRFVDISVDIFTACQHSVYAERCISYDRFHLCHSPVSC